MSTLIFLSGQLLWTIGQLLWTTCVNFGFYFFSVHNLQLWRSALFSFFEPGVNLLFLFMLLLSVLIKKTKILDPENKRLNVKFLAFVKLMLLKII